MPSDFWELPSIELNRYSFSFLPMGTLFTYGTLMDNSVVYNKLGRTAEFKVAQLHGYKRYSLKNRLYPGVMKGAETDVVHGKVCAAE